MISNVQLEIIAEIKNVGEIRKKIIAEVKSKLEFARDEYNYWCDEAKREDEEMKIYQQQYYEEEERLRREAAEEEARRKREASQVDQLVMGKENVCRILKCQEAI